jgi:hypothetical protein
VVDSSPGDRDEDPRANLKGTTYKVYHYMLRQGRPLGISEIQKGLSLSSPSVAQYHIRKLLQLGLIRSEQAGYVVDRVVLENIVRFRRFSIPIQTAYVAFFGATLFVLLLFLRPDVVTSIYFFALVINIAAIGVSAYEMIKTFKRL